MAAAGRMVRLAALAALLLVAFGAGWIVATTGIGATVDPATLPELERQFAQRMTGATLVGSFTVSGREGPARPDRYELESVEKVGDDRWRFNTRMGQQDVTVPVTVTMRWVGDTPMVMLTDLTIPTMGTFTARVFFYDDRYAGIWQHGDVGGQMYGRIEHPGVP